MKLFFSCLKFPLYFASFQHCLEFFCFLLHLQHYIYLSAFIPFLFLLQPSRCLALSSPSSHLPASRLTNYNLSHLTLSISLSLTLSNFLQVTVPGYSVGAEPLDAAQLIETTGEAPSVAVIGGGIAGCGAAWCLQRSGFQVRVALLYKDGWKGWRRVSWLKMCYF